MTHLKKYLKLGKDNYDYLFCSRCFEQNNKAKKDINGVNIGKTENYLICKWYVYLSGKHMKINWKMIRISKRVY